MRHDQERFQPLGERKPRPDEQAKPAQYTVKGSIVTGPDGKKQTALDRRPGTSISDMDMITRDMGDKPVSWGEVLP